MAQFKIERDRGSSEEAVERLIVKENTCLQDIKTIVQNGRPAKRETPYCTWSDRKSK